MNEKDSFALPALGQCICLGILTTERERLPRLSLAEDFGYRI